MSRRKSSSSPLIANDRRLSQTHSENSGGGCFRSHATKKSRISSYFTASPYGGSVIKISRGFVILSAGVEETATVCCVDIGRDLTGFTKSSAAFVKDLQP